jgi:hypothetical protein
MLGICDLSTHVTEKDLSSKMVEFSMCQKSRNWRPMPRHIALPVLPSKPFYKLLIGPHNDTLFVASHRVWRQQRDYYFSTDDNHPGEDMLRSQIQSLAVRNVEIPPIPDRTAQVGLFSGRPFCRRGDLMPGEWGSDFAADQFPLYRNLTELILVDPTICFYNPGSEGEDREKIINTMLV